MLVRVCADRGRESRCATITPGEPVRSIEHARAGSRTKHAAPPLLAAALVAGCSQVLGFQDPRLVGEDGGTSDGSASLPDGGALDGSTGSDGSTGGDASIDAAPDPGVAALWIFTTNGAFQGDLGGMPGRAGADTRCDDAYKASFTARQCTNVHAVLQVDNVNDTLDRMAATYQIPAGAPVLRATADATKVANQWSDVVNRTVQLLAPVSTSSISLYVWSGRGASANRHCNSWQSKDPALIGDTGDASKVSSWLSQVTFACDNITPRLLCVCW